jgi:hypothetical protein
MPYSSQKTNGQTPPESDSATKSGRVQFDARGQAVWEWSVQTGRFDRNASTARVRALSQPGEALELAEAPSSPTGGTNPYERVKPVRNTKPALEIASDRRVGQDLYSFRTGK